MKAIAFLLAVVCFCPVQAEPSLPPVVAVTDDYPPYTYLSQGKPAGLAIEVVNAMFEEAHVLGTIEFMPWRRAYQRGLDEPNVLVFTMSRTPEREALFKWVAPVFSTHVRLYRLTQRTDVQAPSLDAAKRYTIGTVRGYASEKLLIDQGFQPGKQLEQTSSEATSALMFLNGRFDLLCSNDVVLADVLRRNGRTFAEVTPVLTLPPQFDEYMAFSRSTDDRVVEALRAALVRLKQSGRYTAITAKYTQ